MATWKKVIVSGSNAEVNKLNVGGLNQQISSSVADTKLSGSFNGSFNGALTSSLSNTNQANIVGYDTVTGTFTYQGTGSFSASTASYVAGGNVDGAVASATSASHADVADTASFVNTAQTASYALYALTASYASNVPATASYADQALSASYADTAVSASYANSATSASYANSASYTLTASQAISASYLSGSTAMVNEIYPTSGVSANRIFTENSNSGFGPTGSIVIYTSTTPLVLNAGSGTSTVQITGSLVLGQAGATGSLLGTASYADNATSASYANNATTATSASYIANAINNNTATYLLTSTGGGSINGESNLTYSGSKLTVSGSVDISGDLIVAGTASFTNQTTLEIADRFIVVASGSSGLTDGGIIVASGGVGNNISGSAFFLESNSSGTYGRFAIAPNVSSADSSAAPDEFMVTAKASGSAPTLAPTWGGSGNGFGNIYVDSGTGDIYIYS